MKFRDGIEDGVDNFLGAADRIFRLGHEVVHEERVGGASGTTVVVLSQPLLPASGLDDVRIRVVEKRRVTQKLILRVDQSDSERCLFSERTSNNRNV